jgi:outer membrane protein OmpA-like peptidoglycan-associated protein
MTWQVVPRKRGALLQNANVLRARRERMVGSGFAAPVLDLPAQSPVDSTQPQVEQLNDWESEGGTVAPPSAGRLASYWGALVAAPLMIATLSTEYAQAEAASASPGHYPLDQGGGIAVSSANLDEYLAALEGRATARKFLLTFGDLLFSAKSAEIGDSEKGELVRMADYLRSHPANSAHIVGHADDGGDKASNFRLAEQRAAVVRSYLIVQGIEQSRLTTMNGGKDEPLWDNSTGRAGNRRVEILVQKPEPVR